MQLATNTLERVAPLTHAVGNVLKRVFVIGFSIVIFGTRLLTSLHIFLLIRPIPNEAIQILLLVKYLQETRYRHRQV